ncbi:MAG: choice-of-anchor B family protein [Bacteroidia bacterium]
MKKLFFSFVVLLTGVNSLVSQQAKNVTLTGHLSFSHELNDIWGYTDPTGNEYALVGLTHGVSVVDLANPSQPVELHFIPGPVSVWRDLKTFGHYAYVSNETDEGLLIIDLSGLPATVTYKDTLAGGVKTAHNLWIDDNGFLYMIGYNVTGGFKVFDLNGDPWNPVLLGDYHQHYVHDLYARNDRVYTAELSNGLTIVDISDPGLPLVTGNRDYPRAFTHNSWLNDGGNVCFTTDELAEAYLSAWEISDPGDIRFLDRIRSSVNQGKSAPHNVHVLNDFLITSYYADGLNIVDASRPGNLIETGYYDTSPKASGLFEGAWGAYPFLPSGLVLISDIEEGLFVLQPQYKRGCYLEGIATDSETGGPIAQVSVQIAEDSLEEFTLTTGKYATGTADSGIYTVIFSKYGYQPDTFTVMLDHGMLTQLDVALIPLPRTQLKIRILDSNTLNPVAGVQVHAKAPQESATFSYTSGFSGQVSDSRFVINTYEIIVGKWGYVTTDTTLLISPGSDSLVFYLDQGYYDDFALDFGWQVSGNAERGIWERGEPIGTYRETGEIYNPEYDLDNDIGDLVFVTGNGGGGAFGDDVDNGYTLLASPPIDLTNYTAPVLQYAWWFLNWSLNGSAPDGPGNDFLSVQVTDGIDTVELRRYTGPFDTTWNIEPLIPFAKVIDRTRPVKFLFYTQDLEPGNQDAVEAAIDGFRIAEAGSTPVETAIDRPQVRVFPQPAKDLVTISYENQKTACQLRLFNLEGKEVQQPLLLSPGQGEVQVSLSLPGGIYLLQITADGVQVYSGKIVILP